MTNRTHYTITFNPDGSFEGVPSIEMQGPERLLVGESRSELTEQGGVEVAQPGSRAVGEIAIVAELRRHLAFKGDEARLRRDEAKGEGLPNWVVTHIQGEMTALREVSEWLTERTGERSDLSNDLA